MGNKVAAEKENIFKTLTGLREALTREEGPVVKLAAIAAFVQDIYNGIENILKLVLRTKGVVTPSGETWHRDLLRISVSERVLSQGLANELREYLAFRHFFTHSYSFMLSEVKLMPLATNITGVYDRFISEIDVALESLPQE